MKKINFIRFLKIFALALPVLLFVLLSQRYLFYFSNSNEERILRFYQEERDSLDVVFLGASDVFAGFAPALAYEEYGFTSYMYTIDSNRGGLLPYQAEEVLKRQSPQYIIVEINAFLYDRPVEKEQLSVFVENIPLSLNKIEAVWRFKENDRLLSFFPFVIHHGNWSDGEELLEHLNWRLFAANTPSLLKGTLTRTKVDNQLPEDIEVPAEERAIMTVADDDLDEFLRYCQKKNLDNVVFVRFPHKMSDMQAECVELIKDRVQEYGYPFLNLENHKEDMGLDILQDYYNPEHLNIYGQKKLTTYLGKLLLEDYQVRPVVQSENNRLHWEDCVHYYHSYYEYAHEHISKNSDIVCCEYFPEFFQFLDWISEQETA